MWVKQIWRWGEGEDSQWERSEVELKTSSHGVVNLRPHLGLVVPTKHLGTSKYDVVAYWDGGGILTGECGGALDLNEEVTGLDRQGIPVALGEDQGAKDVQDLTASLAGRRDPALVCASCRVEREG